MPVRVASLSLFAIRARLTGRLADRDARIAGAVLGGHALADLARNRVGTRAGGAVGVGGAGDQKVLAAPAARKSARLDTASTALLAVCVVGAGRCGEWIGDIIFDGVIFDIRLLGVGCLGVVVALGVLFVGGFGVGGFGVGSRVLRLLDVGGRVFGIRRGIGGRLGVFLRLIRLIPAGGYGCVRAATKERARRHKEKTY